MLFIKRDVLKKSTAEFGLVTTIEKTIDEGDERIIEGVATTPDQDRTGDIINPMGAEYSLPIPLLWQHDHGQPIGKVTKAKKTKDGIRFTAVLSKTDTEGATKSRLDDAWDQIKLGLVSHVSIGARKLEWNWRDDHPYGRKIDKWEWLELSVVTIPAHQGAKIDAIKEFDANLIAALGEKSGSGKPPAAAGKIVKLTGESKMSYQAQLNTVLKTLEAKRQERDQIQKKASDEGRAKSADEREEFEGLTGDIKSLEQEAKDLRALIEDEEAVTKAAEKQAKPIEKAQVQAGRAVVIERKHVPGLDIARAAMCLMQADGNRQDALELAEKHYAAEPRVGSFLKAAVAGNTTLDDPGTAPIAEAQTMVNEFLDYLWPETIVGRLGVDGRPAPRRVPFNKKVSRAITAGKAAFVGQGKPIPVSRQVFDQVALSIHKVGALCVFSNDLFEFGNLDTEMLVRDNIAGAVVEHLDEMFSDPTNAGTAGVEPASIFNGLAAIAASGTDGDAVSTDVTKLIAPLIAAKHKVRNIAIIMNSELALGISGLKTALGAFEYPELTPSGGILRGFPVIASEAVPLNMMGAFDVRGLLLARGDSIRMDISREASVEMNDAPTQDGGAGTGSSVVSLLQNDMLGIRALHHITWELGYPTMASVITDAAYGGVTPPATA